MVVGGWPSLGDEVDGVGEGGSPYPIRHPPILELAVERFAGQAVGHGWSAWLMRAATPSVSPAGILNTCPSMLASTVSPFSSRPTLTHCGLASLQRAVPRNVTLR